jgi:hypothetical protein
VLVVLLVLAGVVFADVVYVYSGVFNVVTTKSPLTFAAGPNAYPTTSAAAPYLNVTTSGQGFTVTMAATNASGAYYYQAVELVVDSPGRVYVGSVGVSGHKILNNMTIYIQSSSGATICSFIVIQNSTIVTTSTSSCSLSAGTYYISVLAYFNVPVFSGEVERVVVVFGYDVVGNASVLPP